MAKTRIVLLIAALTLVLAVPFSAKAALPQAEQTVYVAKDQTIDGSFYSAGVSITVDGNVKGDVICAAQSVIINGNVDGDVICVAQSITINGKVGGSLRTAANSVVLNGTVGHTAMMAGTSVSVSPSAVIGWDAMVAGASVELGGNIKRDVFGAGSQVRISGNVGRQVTLYLNAKGNNKETDKTNFFITKSAVINGNVSYTSFNDAKVETGSTIKGEIKRQDPKILINKDKTARDATVGWLWYSIIAIFAALIVGLVMTSWLVKPLNEITEKIFSRTFKNLGWGFLVLFLSPFIIAILAITVIGLPLALILLGLWLLILYPAKIIVAIALGRKLVNKINFLKRYKDSLMGAMVFGVIVAWIIFSIPVIGWILSVIAVLIGVGGIWHYARAKN
jgi:cytoskeletal protein CcmA (bactofilin family)